MSKKTIATNYNKVSESFKKLVATELTVKVATTLFVEEINKDVSGLEKSETMSDVINGLYNLYVPAKEDEAGRKSMTSLFKEANPFKAGTKAHTVFQILQRLKNLSRSGWVVTEGQIVLDETKGSSRTTEKDQDAKDGKDGVTTVTFSKSKIIELLNKIASADNIPASAKSDLFKAISKIEKAK